MFASLIIRKNSSSRSYILVTASCTEDGKPELRCPSLLCTRILNFSKTLLLEAENGLSHLFDLLVADDLAEDAALSFFPQGRPENVLKVIRECMNDDFIENIRRELYALPGQPYWKHGWRLPTLMSLIGDAYREAHRDLFLIRRYRAVISYDIPN